VLQPVFFSIPVFRPKLELYQVLWPICVYVSVYPAVFLIYFISAAVILFCVCCCNALNFHYRNKDERTSVLYNFILVIVKVFVV